MAKGYLQRRPSSAGDTTTATISVWVKHQFPETSSLDFMHAYNGSASNRMQLMFRDTGNLEFWSGGGGSRFAKSCADRGGGEVTFHDQAGQWMHIMAVMNTPAIREDQRCRIYVNGVEQSLIDAPGSTLTGIPQGPSGDPEQLNARVIHHICGVANDSTTDATGSGEKTQMCDYFFVDGLALTPEVFGYYKDDTGTQAVSDGNKVEHRSGQWRPRLPKSVKNTIERSGGFGTNGFYLPMNDSSNVGADFHCTPNSIIKLKGEDLPQPRNGAPATSDNFVSQLRDDPYAANLVLAIPGILGGTNSGCGDYSADIKGSGTNKTVTAVEDAKVYSFPSYYGSAIKFDGSGDYLTVPNSSDFSLGTGDFTVELWLYRQNSGSTEGLIGVFENAGVSRRSWQLETRASQGLRFQWWQDGATAGGTLDTPSFTVPTNQWTHVCAERYGDLVTLYINGIAIKYNTSPGSFYNNTSDPLRIGVLNAGLDQPLYGYLKDIRVYKGVAKYKGGFDVPHLWAPQGVASWKATSDVPGNTFCSMNRLASIDLRRNTTAYVPTEVQFTNGNLDVRNAGAGGFAPLQQAHSTFGMDSGKWYWECSNFAAASNERFGISLGPEQIFTQTGNGGAVETPLWVNGSDGTLAVGGNHNGTDYEFLLTGTINNTNASAISNNDIIGLAFDRDNMSLTVYKNGVQTVSATNLVSQSKVSTWFASKSSAGSANVSGQSYNFGQNPTFCGTLGNIASARVNSTNASWDQSANTGTHVDWTVSSDGRSLDVAVPSGNYARARLTIDPAKKYLFSFRYNTGPANLGIQNEDGYIIANDGSASPSGLSSGNTYTFEISNSSQIIVTGFTGSTYSLSSVLVTEIVPAPYSDENGKGEFRYQPPSGYLALCSDNLPAPTIANPSEYFTTVLYDGISSTGRRQHVGFKPDLIWFKSRSTQVSNILCDSIRGPQSHLSSDTANSENTSGTTYLSGFSQSGFDLDDGVNSGGDTSGRTYVAWCWKAGGAAVLNDAGSIDSQVSVNQDAGFSIVSYTSTGSNDALQTVGHGLSKSPNMILLKNRDAATNWRVYHSGIPSGNSLSLNTNETSFSFWPSVGDSTFGLANSTTTGQAAGSNGEKIIAYCWTEIPGFSKFSVYQGTDQLNGPMCVCGFKPAWVMIKRTDVADNWHIADSARKSTNPVNMVLRANLNNAESENNTSFNIDFLSNGFKIRSANSELNDPGGMYVYAAFAETPFQTANAK